VTREVVSGSTGSLDTLVIYVRVVASRTGSTVAELCERLAQRHGVDVATPN